MLKENHQHLFPEIKNQLAKISQLEVEFKGVKIKLDYKIAEIESERKKAENEKKNPVFILTGFGAGLSRSNLSVPLLCNGRKVILLSLPGYGNSDNPPFSYFSSKNFNNEAEIVSLFFTELKKKGELLGKKIHLVAHSMGGEIISSVAEKGQDDFLSLNLLSSAGVKERENLLLLGIRFTLSERREDRKFTEKMRNLYGENYQEKIPNFFPNEIDSWHPERRWQRIFEMYRFKKGELLKKMQNIDLPVNGFVAQILFRV